MEKKLNVLLIEDDPIIAMDISLIVKKTGCYVVQIVDNLEDAIDITNNSNVDLVITDIRLGGEKDGIDIAEILQKRYNLPIIFLTAFEDDATLQRVTKVDFMGYLVKPFREDELSVLLRLCMKRQIQKQDTLEEICNGYAYHASTKEVYHYNKQISLTNNEKTLLYILINAKGSIVEYKDIDGIIWLDGKVTDTARRQLLHRLKSKMPTLCLEVIKGQGYRLTS